LVKSMLLNFGKRLRITFFTKIDLYFYKELLPNYAFGLTFFTILIMLNELFVLTSYYFEHNVPIEQVLMLLINLIPFLLSFSMPFGILPAYLLTMGRLSQDSEFTAMRACGISTWRIVLPGIIFGLIISSAVVLFKDKVEAQANINYLRLRARVMASKPAVELKESAFLQIGSYNISFERMEVENDMEVLYNLHVVDFDNRKTIQAEMGRFFSSPENPELYVLKFHNGSISEVIRTKDDKTGQINENFFISSFSYLALNAYISLPSELHGQSPDAMSVSEVREEIAKRGKPVFERMELEKQKRETLLDEINEKNREFRQTARGLQNQELDAAEEKHNHIIERLRREVEESEKRLESSWRSLPKLYMYKLHDKFAMPFASFVFVILSLSIGMYTERSGRSEGLGISIIIMIVYYGMKIGTENLIVKHIFPPFAQWLPNLVFLSLGSFLLYRKLKQ